MLVHGELTGKIIAAVVEVHRVLGPGLLESVYEECLCHELRLRGIAVERQVPLPINYKGVRLDAGYQMDIVVDGRVILELKCVETLLPVHEAQLMTYLRISELKVGFLINFNVPVAKDGIVRRVL